MTAIIFLPLLSSYSGSELGGALLSTPCYPPPLMAFSKEKKQREGTELSRTGGETLQNIKQRERGLESILVTGLMIKTKLERIIVIVI